MRRPGIRISKTGQDGKQDKGNKMNEIENFDKMKTIFLREYIQLDLLSKASSLRSFGLKL